jgi:hypothetical protein
MEALVQKHHIKPANMWNFDEKGFMLGICQATKRIVPVKHLQGKCRGTVQDGSREFISVLACVNATGECLPPALIYQGDSGDLQNTWLEDYNPEIDKAYFAVSPKGWTSDVLGRAWLTRFAQDSEKTTSNRLHKRLLILDGHSSHVNMNFIEAAIAQNILVIVFPPHSTHRLQPLDVSVFSPLAHYYSEALNSYIHNSHAFSRVTKRVFWPLFDSAWKKSMKKETILSGFTKTGLYPFNPSLVLDQLAYTSIELSDSSENDEITVKNVRDVRKLIKKVQRKQRPRDADEECLIKSLEEMSIDKEILEHQVSQLRSTLIFEVKRRKRGKPMGLLSSEETKFGQFWSPQKIARRREEIDAKEAQITQEKALKVENKLQATIERENKAQKQRARVLANRIERERKKLEKTAEIERKKKLREHAKALKKLKSARPTALQRFQQGKQRLSTVTEPESVYDTEIRAIVTTARSGRTVNKPARFHQF